MLSKDTLNIQTEKRSQGKTVCNHVCCDTHILNEQEKPEQQPCVAQLKAEVFHFISLFPLSPSPQLHELNHLYLTFLLATNVT